MTSLKRNIGITSSVSILAVFLFGCTSSNSNNPTGSGGTQGGGTGGQGGSVNCGSDNPDDVISDFTTDNGLHPADGRSGGWYLYPSEPGTFDPPLSSPYPIDSSTGTPGCSGPGSLHTKATGFGGTSDAFGAALQTDFVPATTNDAGAAVKGTYDASKYTGISFWAKATATLQFVQIKFPDAYTDDQADPTLFDSSGIAACALNVSGFPNNCSPFIVKFSAGSTDTNYPKYMNTVIDTTWRRFDVFFADTVQDMFNPGQAGPNNMLDVHHLTSFGIQVNADFSTKPPIANDFEIWIDDVRFIRP
jgi:hypothetical protein